MPFVAVVPNVVAVAALRSESYGRKTGGRREPGGGRGEGNGRATVDEAGLDGLGVGADIEIGPGSGEMISGDGGVVDGALDDLSSNVDQLWFDNVLDVMLCLCIGPEPVESGVLGAGGKPGLKREANIPATSAGDGLPEMEFWIVVWTVMAFSGGMAG